MSKPAPILSIHVLHSELIRLVSPRLLSDCPSIGNVQNWLIDIVQVKGGLRFDLIRPASAEEAAQ